MAPLHVAVEELMHGAEVLLDGVGDIVPDPQVADRALIFGDFLPSFELIEAIDLSVHRDQRRNDSVEPLRVQLSVFSQSAVVFAVPKDELKDEVGQLLLPELDRAFLAIVLSKSRPADLFAALFFLGFGSAFMFETGIKEVVDANVLALMEWLIQRDSPYRKVDYG